MSRTASMNVGYLKHPLERYAAIKVAGNIPFFDNVIQSIYGLVFFQTFCTTPLTSSQGTGQLLSKGFVFAEFFQYGLMGDIGDILRIIKGC